MKRGIFADKPTFILECSSCRAPLVEVIQVKETGVITKVTAKCCFCGDKSFKANIDGKLVYSSTDFCHATPYPVYKPRQYSDDPYEPTDEMTVETKKIKEWRR